MIYLELCITYCILAEPACFFLAFLGSSWLLSTVVPDLARLTECVLVLKVIQTVLLFHSREHIKHWKESLPAPVVTDMLTSLVKGICVSFPLALSLASAIDTASRWEEIKIVIYWNCFIT